MDNSTKKTTSLQAPSFEQAHELVTSLDIILSTLYSQLKIYTEYMKINDRQIKIINKRLDILDQILLNRKDNV